MLTNLHSDHKLPAKRRSSVFRLWTHERMNPSDHCGVVGSSNHVVTRLPYEEDQVSVATDTPVVPPAGKALMVPTKVLIVPHLRLIYTTSLTRYPLQTGVRRRDAAV